MLFRTIGHIINYEVKLYARKGGEIITVLGFFLIAVTLFPFALGADNPGTARYAPAYVWVVALLATLLSLPGILHRDMADGALDQLRLSPIALEWALLAKCSANWMTCQLPLIFVSPLAGMMLGMTEMQCARLMASLLLATPLLCCIGALGAALTLHARNKSGVLAVLVLPLYMPVLIFSTILGMTAPETAFFSHAEALLLLGLLLAAVPLCGWAGAWIIRLQD